MIKLETIVIPITGGNARWYNYFENHFSFVL